MRDAMGGIVNIALIVIFLVIIMGYLAFNINYMKAFKVKNKIITTFEQYEGACENKESPCRREIQKYINQVGYNTNFEWKNLDGGYTKAEGFAYQRVTPEKAGINDTEKFYYKIVTQITIDIPIINKVLDGLDTFRITGDTKAMEVRK